MADDPDDTEVRRALEDPELRERLFATQTATARFLRRVGAYAEPTYRDIDFTDWNGALVGRGSEIDREAVAPDASLPFAAFAALAAMGPFARALVAAHPSTPTRELAQLAETDDERVQVALVKRSDLDDAARRRLAKSPIAGVRATLAADPALSLDVGELLRQDPEPQVRSVVARRGELDPAWIQALARDADPNVRHAIANRTALDRASVERLGRDPNAGVRRAIAARADVDHALLFELARDSEVAPTIAARTDLDRALFDELAAHARPHLVELLSRSGLVTPAHLSRFADINASAVAGHPKTPPEALARIAATSEHLLVLRVVAARPRLPPALAENPTIDEATATILATDPMSNVREQVARRSDAPIEVLELIARDSQTLVCRYATETLAKLRKP